MFELYSAIKMFWLGVYNQYWIFRERSETKIIEGKYFSLRTMFKIIKVVNVSKMLMRNKNSPAIKLTFFMKILVISPL